MRFRFESISRSVVVLRIRPANLTYPRQWLTGAPKFWGIEGDPNRPRWIEPGITPGHEIVGTIVEGDGPALAQRKVELGDRVTVEQIVPW